MKKILLLIVVLIGVNEITHAQNQSPVVSITSPSKYSVVYSNDVFTLSALASDPDGSIAKVEFYAGNNLVGTDNSFPYSVQVSKVQLPLPTWGWSDWSITVKAYDNSGNITTVKTPSNVYVSMRPSNDAGISSAGLGGRGSAARTLSPWIVLNKNGFLNNITIATIAYQLDNNPEEIISWAGNINDPNIGQLINIPSIANSNGKHKLTYRILSRNGLPSDEIAANDTYEYNFISNIANISVPVVSLTAPVASTVSSTTILLNQPFTLKANAIDNDGGWVTKVEFYVDGQLVGEDTQAPYELTKNDISIGSHKILAKAIDDLGGVGTSATATLIVKPNLDAAISNVIVPGFSALTSNISPIVVLKNTGVETLTSAIISYSVDGGVAQTFNWNGSLSAGMTVNAYLPTYRNEDGAHSFTVTVSNPNGSTDGDASNNSSTRNYTSLINNVAPTARMLTPAVKSTAFEGTAFEISATATDRDGWITKVEFYVDDILVGTVSKAPYTLTKNDISVGNHTIKVKAYDDRNGSSISNTSTLVVVPALNVAITGIISPSFSTSAANITPIITIKNLGKNNLTSANITYTIDGGEAKNLNWTGTLAPNAAINVTLPTFRNENGNHTFLATVSNPNNGIDGDVSNNSITRSFISTVYNAAPTVRMATPAFKSTINSKATFTLSATAADRDGWVTKVEFYLGNTLVGTDTEAPYALTLSNWPVGTHNVTAKAYDDRNSSTVSAATTLVVVAAPSPAGLMIAVNNDVASNITQPKETLNLTDKNEVGIEITEVKNEIKKVDTPKAVMQISPNPATSYAQIDVNIVEEGIYQVAILNMAGQTVITKKVEMMKGNNTIPLELNSITAGVYFVNLNFGNIILNKKLVIN